MDSLYGIFELLIGPGLLIGFIVLITYLARPNKQNQPPVDWRRFGVGVAIITVLPCFVGYLTSAVFDKLQSTNSLIMMVTISIAFIIAGLFIAHHTVISASLMIGSIIAVVYAVGLNIDTVPPSVITILAGVGLALLIYFAYQRLREKEAI